MRKRLILIGLMAATLASCGSRGAVVYESSGSGGAAPPETNSESTGFDYTDDMPKECVELTQPCQTCDEVEMTRRRILQKKCVRVCDAYVDAGPAFAENVAPRVDAILRKPGVCGKSETTCTAVEKSQCRYAMEYASVARPFVTSWATTNSVPPVEELLSKYHEGVLVPVDRLHRQVFEWGRVNEADLGPLFDNYTAILKTRLGSTSQEVLGEASSALPPKDESGSERVRTMYRNVKSLTDTAMAPGDSFEVYRSSWDTANESFVTKRKRTATD